MLSSFANYGQTNVTEMFLKGLPDEILSHILANNEIAISDMGHLMLTCKQLRNFIHNSQELWKQKFLTRYAEFNICKWTFSMKNLCVMLMHSRWPRLHHF